MQPLSHSRRKLTPLLATGQTTSYVDYDDGYYKKGIVKAYTVLSAGQYSGTVNLTLNAKTDVHSNNCVFDHNTGLMWSRVDPASIGPGSDGKLPWTTNGDGEGIFPFCAAANAASLAGYADWRVPNQNESLLLANIETRCLDLTAFPGIAITAHWTSSTSNPYAVSFQIYWGSVYPWESKTDNFLVMLVRG